MASASLLNNQPFFNPAFAIKSAALFCALAATTSVVVNKIDAFKFFSCPNRFFIASGNSSPVFKNLYLSFLKIFTPIFFKIASGFLPSCLPSVKILFAISFAYSLYLPSSVLISVYLFAAIFMSLFLLTTFLAIQLTELSNISLGG